MSKWIVYPDSMLGGTRLCCVEEVDDEGFKKVHISGEVAYVLAAIEEV